MWAPRGGLDRERVERLVEEGRSIAEIASELDRSKATVRHWLRKWDLKTLRAQRLQIGVEPGDGDLSAPARRSMVCERHGEGTFALEGRGYYRCVRCRSESVARHRRRVKEILVAEAGGHCVVCGYDRHVRALEFHHINPREKRLGLSAGGVTLSLRALRVEAAKCVLLCSNCHAEVEDGLITLPIQLAAGSPER
jgi:5-methylcytosine-specific restriction endonuclease McrA